MWLPIQSIYDGTWGEDTIPQEVADHELMREMHWSWREFQETPLYVRRFNWDCIQARRAAESAAHEAAAPAAAGVVRVRR